MHRHPGPTGLVRPRWTTLFGALFAAAVILNSSVVVVTAVGPRVAHGITVTAPTGTGTYAVGSRLTVSWTTSSVISAGEFGVWVQSATGVRYVERIVPPNGGVNHTTALMSTASDSVRAKRPATLSLSGAWNPRTERPRPTLGPSIERSCSSMSGTVA